MVLSCCLLIHLSVSLPLPHPHLLSINPVLNLFSDEETEADTHIGSEGQSMELNTHPSAPEYIALLQLGRLTLICSFIISFIKYLHAYSASTGPVLGTAEGPGNH